VTVVHCGGVTGGAGAGREHARAQQAWTGGSNGRTVEEVLGFGLGTERSVRPMRRISVGTPGDNRGAPFDVVAVKTTPSRSSGKPLEELVVISLLPMHDALLLQRALEEGVVRVYDEHDDDQERHYSRYHVGTYITSERSAHDARAFEIQLVEIEDLRLSGLSIAGVEFPAPYRYTEEFRGAGLEIVARIKVNVDELDQLYKLSITDPHEVVRHGVTEESRLMSLLVTAWSPASDETATCEVWLGDPRDLDSDWALVAKSVGMGRDALAGVDALLAALEQRGVLPAEAMDAIQEDVERRRRDLHFHMFEVHDLETDVEWRGR
jgi:hypothetical protein